MSSFVDSDGVMRDIPGIVIDVDQLDRTIVADAEEFGHHAGRGHGWRLGLLVARSVEPDSGNPNSSRVTNVTRKVSARAFAERAGTSAPRVLRYYEGWERAAAAGLVPHASELHKGTDPDVDLNKLPAWKNYFRPPKPEEPEVVAASWHLVEGWHHCAVADLVKHVEPESVDVIVTDPPYPFEFLATYADLSRTATAVLKPGGLCVTMAGQSYLPAVLEKLDEGGLRYHWTIAYRTPGGQSVQLWDRNVNTFWKPVLVYTNGTYEGDWFGDVAESDVNDNDKDYHHWGQSESGMADLIRRVSKPGDLVCDPFLGGGTTAVVAAQIGRRIIGSDINADALDVARRRFT